MQKMKTSITKEELIALQQLKIEEYKIAMEENKETVKSLKNKLFAIGAPLNDNRLQFNKEQLRWCFELEGLIENINCI